MYIFVGQKTTKVLKVLKALKLISSFVPESCASLVQPLDTRMNKNFKDKVSELINELEELERNPRKWQEGNFTIGDRRILVTHCVGNAWEQPHELRKDVIVKLFRQVGLPLNVDRSEDSKPHVKDLSDLVIGDWKQGGLDSNLN